MNFPSFFRLGALSLFALLFAACDIVDGPYLERGDELPADAACVELAAQQDPFASGQAPARVVLLEEMTGHKCGNCPLASEEAYELYTQEYPGQLAFVSIHAGPLARFNPGADKFGTNFTTEAGDDFFATLNNAKAVPFGMIDRKYFSTAHGTWGGRVANELALPSAVALHVTNCYEPDSLTLTTVIDVKYLLDATAKEYLSVFLVEDGIVDWQKHYTDPTGPDLPQYVHHNVLRTAVNGTWGQPLSLAQVKANDRFTQAYTLQLDSAYAAENCKIVAFTYDFENNEVRQAIEVPVVN